MARGPKTETTLKLCKQCCCMRFTPNPKSYDSLKRVITTATKLNHPNCLKTVLARFPDSDRLLKRILTDKNFKSPVEIAANTGDTAMTRYLIELGFDADMRLLLIALAKGNKEAFVEINKKVGFSQFNLCMHLIPGGSATMVENLVRWDFDIPEQATIDAAMRGNVDVLELLLKLDYELPAQVMYHAVRLRNDKLVRLLIEYKISISPIQMHEIVKIADIATCQRLIAAGYTGYLIDDILRAKFEGTPEQPKRKVARVLFP